MNDPNTTAEPEKPDPRDDLRERLEAMRESLIEGLANAPHIDGGQLALLGTIGMALISLEWQP